MSLRKILLSLSLLASLAGFSQLAYSYNAGLYPDMSGAWAACRTAWGEANCQPWYTGANPTSSNCTARAQGVFRKDSSNFYYCYLADSLSCSSPEVLNPTTKKCEPACTVPGKETLAASDPLCVANPCTAGQSATFVWSPGMRTGPGENDHNASYNIPASQCDGTCTINKPATLDTLSCLSSGTNYPVPIICTLTGTKSGDQCATSDQATQPTGTTTPETPTQSLACPDGQAKQADGSCEAPATSGTASTSTGAGTAATPGALSCPVGMSSQLVDDVYKCVGTAPPAGINCPPDYSRVGENCVSNHEINPNSRPISGTGGGATEGTLKEIANKLDGDTYPHASGNALIQSKQAYETGWFGNIVSTAIPNNYSWSPIIPTAECAPYDVMGKTIDICPVVTKVRDLAGYFFYILTAFSIFYLVMGANREGS